MGVGCAQLHHVLCLSVRTSEHRNVFGSLFSSVTLLDLVQNFSEPLPLVELQELYPLHVRTFGYWLPYAM